MGSCERSGFTSGWPCAFLWVSVLLCSDVGSTFYCPHFWQVRDCGPLTNGEVGLGPSSSSPVAVRPRLGLGLLRRPFGCCLSHARCLVGFPRLVGWLAALLEVYLPVSSGWSLCGVPQVLRLSSPGGRVVVSAAGIAVRALLQATSIPLTHGVPLTLGRCARRYLSWMVRRP